MTSLEQMSSGQLYAALIAGLENEKVALQRERGTLKEELAAQILRNTELEKAVEVLRGAQTQAQEPQKLVPAPGDAGCLDRTWDEEFEPTLTTPPTAPPETRPPTKPHPPDPSSRTGAAEAISISEGVSPSHERSMPWSGENIEDPICDGYLTDMGYWWAVWASPSKAWVYRGKLIKFPEGIETSSMRSDEGNWLWLFRSSKHPGKYPLYSTMIKYRCVTKGKCKSDCSCKWGKRANEDGTRELANRLVIVGNELHLSKD